ncbi:MAG: hypothetical protein EKK63_01720 [Acinetobacter sp.]|uniref:hypothetical protein n=1 Tax=Acinetobacter sp. TaxID=472 RepID=UPI000F9483C2|nr:hypothetical protein [Acinetobacter sp.]RUP42323.1 MAG: hypothetical protein EKK63_01720 [Acinetobacter sp.]
MQNLKNRMDSIDRKNNAEYQKRREEAAVKEIVFDEQPPQTAEISDDEDVKLVKEWITWHCFKKKKKLKMRSCLKLLKNKYNINAERPDKSK